MFLVLSFSTQGLLLLTGKVTSSRACHSPHPYMSQAEHSVAKTGTSEEQA